MNPTDISPIHILSYGQNLLDELTSHIIEKHLDNLPDLTHVTILLPSTQSSTLLRKTLLEKANKYNHQALLGPEINTLTDWINASCPDKHKIIFEQQRELMLVEALVGHPYLYGKASPWSLADSLLELFDDLGDRNIHISNNYDEFLNLINNAYLENNNNSIINSEELTREAKLVHTLWQAWHQQMQESEVVDRHTGYLLKLKASEQQDHTDRIFYLAGFSQFSPAEESWLSASLNKGNTLLWLQASQPPGDNNQYHPDMPVKQLLSSLEATYHYPDPNDPYGYCLNTIFGCSEVTIQDRAKQFAHDFPESPVASRLSLFEAKSAEHEAMAIDLQTRLWRLGGKKQIGIVTENRKLARRVRALLERANIELQDAAGWALSTTSAAAVLERWLETVEEDYAYQPLLDLLKSPFFFPATKWQGKNRDDLLNTVYHFEQGIILKENINRGLERYKKHIKYRQNRLPEELAAVYDDVYALLELLSEAAEPIIPFLGKNNHNPSALLKALGNSLEILELDTSLSIDDAGRKIIQELEQMALATEKSSLQMSWTEFRNWLGRVLERHNFQPNIQTGCVQLMSMAQIPLHQFDALIIAGAEKEYLPGNVNSSPFFNDGVRQSLGLSSQTEKLSRRFYQFRRLLESSKEIVITRRVEHDDEDIVSSPWLERIQSFHSIAYENNLINHELTRMTGHPDSIVTDRSTVLPKPVDINPAVSITEDLIPRHISASAYQQLIDCPYQFFAARCLKLEPLESIKEMLEKSDYGERVHLCLQAFHSGVKNLPGPFKHPFTTANRDEAIHCLTSIADEVFAKDLEDNFLHRAWLKRWHDLIPAYIDWQIGQQLSWNVDSTEHKVETVLNGMNIPIAGRIDRIDTSKDTQEKNYNILDYKTGKVARKDDVLAGESIQLPFYALLAKQALQKSASRVEYVSLDKDKVETKTTLEGDELNKLTLQIEQRLVDILTDIEKGKPMTAWGDDSSCEWCQMSGICRRESWQVEKGPRNPLFSYPETK